MTLLPRSTDAVIPYVCSKCGREDCKLWREYQTFLEHQRLLCGECALADQGKTGPIDGEGNRPSDIAGRTDQIGWMVPAIPTDDGTFWGYTSVPPEDVAWWRALPT